MMARRPDFIIHKMIVQSHNLGPIATEYLFKRVECVYFDEVGIQPVNLKYGLLDDKTINLKSMSFYSQN